MAATTPPVSVIANTAPLLAKHGDKHTTTLPHKPYAPQQLLRPSSLGNGISLNNDVDYDSVALDTVEIAGWSALAATRAISDHTAISITTIAPSSPTSECCCFPWRNSTSAVAAARGDDHAVVMHNSSTAACFDGDDDDDDDGNDDAEDGGGGGDD